MEVRSLYINIPVSGSHSRCEIYFNKGAVAIVTQVRRQSSLSQLLVFTPFIIHMSSPRRANCGEEIYHSGQILNSAFLASGGQGLIKLNVISVELLRCLHKNFFIVISQFTQKIIDHYDRAGRGGVTWMGN